MKADPLEDIDDRIEAARERARADREAWQPSDEQIALFPAISGNTVNGLGERDPRRAKIVYWDSPEGLPHGELQAYFYERYFEVDAIKETYHAGRGPSELAAVALKQVERPAVEWAAQVRQQAFAMGCEMVGIAAMRDEWVYEGHEVSEPWIIMLGLVMDQPRLATAPSTPDDPTSAVEVAVNLARITKVSNTLTNWIREQGWDAEPRPGPRPAGDIPLIPPAIACGFGQLGKHGSLIHPEYGSSFRLAAVTTTMPLVADAPRDFGVDEFCASCQVCRRVCPPDAIFDEKQPVRGALKWYVDFDKCVPYFNDHYGCGICIAECPWSIPGVAPRLVEKLARRERSAAEVDPAEAS